MKVREGCATTQSHCSGQTKNLRRARVVVIPQPVAVVQLTAIRRCAGRDPTDVRSSAWEDGASFEARWSWLPTAVFHTKGCERWLLWSAAAGASKATVATTRNLPSKPTPPVRRAQSLTTMARLQQPRWCLRRRGGDALGHCENELLASFAHAQTLVLTAQQKRARSPLKS